MRFEWDPKKAAASLRKHGVSFDEAVSGPDPDHSMGEHRFITFGQSRLGRLIAVHHAHRPGTIRIFSARRMTRGERKFYEEG
ncbi:MAG: BrnT family toxin [Betaproteobacteria bacterium]|nr:BrnT family toxin [Betaproteobacteria bacterium]